MSRTKHFLHGVWLGYTYQALLMVVGLWLTPFLLHHIGHRDFGVWILGTQLLTYLALLDIGVLSLTPREIAYVTGRIEGAGQQEELSVVFGRMVRILLHQATVVVIAVLVIWFFMPASWREFRGPIGVILATFAIVFPLRIFQSVLQGLQDFQFIGRTQIVSWVASTLLTVALVLAGAGLYALAIGWAAAQLLLAGTAAYRLWSAFPGVIPGSLPKLTWAAVSKYLISGVWITISQMSTTLLVSDVLIIGKLYGPSAVVPYSCTIKLCLVLANQPTLIMQAAEPGLSQLKTGASRERILQAVTALTQAIVMLSGLVACVVFAMNHSFVSWWVGAAEFSGLSITALYLVSMMLRHWNTTAVYSNFCFGYERRISLTTLVDGAVTVGMGFLLAWWLGPIGAPMGNVLGVALVSLPSNLSTLRREVGVPFRSLIAPLWPWFWRFVPVCAGAVAFGLYYQTLNFYQIGATSLLVGLAYVAIMFGPSRQSALGLYLMPRLVPLWRRLSWAR